MALTILATYDIAQNRARSKVAALLQRWGDRLQRSVFMCVIEPDDLDKLLERVKTMIDLDTDSFLVFRQCGQCWEKMAAVGQTTPERPTLFWSVM